MFDFTIANVNLHLLTSAQQLLIVPMTLHLLTYGDTVRLVIGWVT